MKLITDDGPRSKHCVRDEISPTSVAGPPATARSRHLKMAVSVSGNACLCQNVQDRRIVMQTANCRNGCNPLLRIRVWWRISLNNAVPQTPLMIANHLTSTPVKELMTQHLACTRHVILKSASVFECDAWGMFLGSHAHDWLFTREKLIVIHSWEVDWHLYFLGDGDFMRWFE